MYHLRDDHQVSECSAKSPEDCPYRSNGPHFTSWDDAEAESQRRLQSEFDLLPVTRRKSNIQKRFRSIASRGIPITVESASHAKADSISKSSFSILRHSPDADNDLLARIRSGSVTAFQR